MKYILSTVVIILVAVGFYAVRHKPDLYVGINEYLKNKPALVSVSVEALDSDRIITIGGDKEFYRASLSKVSIMIAIFIEAEENPSLLDKKYIFTQVIKKIYEGQPQNPPIQNPMIVGQSYTVDDLVSRMIKESDNNALATLTAYFPQAIAKQSKVRKDLGLLEENTNPDYVSSVNYNKAFSALYKAYYLNRAMSDKALALLADTNYKDGLVAGVPQNIKVAHKFGIYHDLRGQTGLNDCGIVYATNPYTICIMVFADNSIKPDDIIKDISKMVYQELK